MVTAAITNASMVTSEIQTTPQGAAHRLLMTLDPRPLEPADQTAEVVAGGEDGVGGVTPTVQDIVSAHAVLGLEMADHWFDSGSAAQFALDLRRQPSLLAGDIGLLGVS